MSGPALANIGGPPPTRGADRHDGKLPPRTIISPNLQCSAGLESAAAAAFWPIGPVQLKGLAEPVAVYAVQAAALDAGGARPGGRCNRPWTSRAPTGAPICAMEDEDAA